MPDRVQRASLLQKMSDLTNAGIGCTNCRGECCTSMSNSMQISEAEAQELFLDLQMRHLLTPELIQRIKQTIVDYRLDVEIPSYGSRQNIRRTYTCPFFSLGPAGCAISMDKKPLGCLAFNATKPRATGLASGCRSDQESLLECTPDGPKLPIPVAIWRLIQKARLSI